MNLCIFSLSVFIFPSVADSDLLCVPLVHCVTWTKTVHAIWKTQTELKPSSSSPPPATFPGQFFPVWAVCCLRVFRAQWNMQRFWTTDKTELGALLFPICPKRRIRKDLLSLPSLLSTDLQRKESEFEEAEWKLQGSPSCSYVCVIMVAVAWCNTEQRHCACITLDLGEKQKCRETASCQELFPAVLQTGWLCSWKTGHILPDVRDSKWGCALVCRLERSFEPLPMSTGRMLYESSFTRVPSYRWGKRMPK